MRWVILTFLMLFSLVIESTVFRYLSFNGIQPDLVLILVIFCALFSGPYGGAFFGFLGGLAQDALTGQFLGMNAMTKMLIGFISARIERNVYRDHALIPALLVAVLSLLSQFISYFVTAAFIPMPSFFNVFFTVFIPAAGYNCLLAALVYSKFHHSITKGWLRSGEY